MSAEKTQDTVIKKEMGFGHKEFYDGLPRLLKGIPYQQDENSVRFQIEGKDVEITLAPEGSRYLTPSMSLPITLVTLRFSDCSTAQIDAFIKHFNLCFLKGGG